MEGDRLPEEAFCIVEASGIPPVTTPMTEEQAYYLHNYVDPQVDMLIANLEAEKVRRKLSDEYQQRTISGLRER